MLHFRQGASRNDPWRGRGPLDVAGTGARLIANLEASLSNEAGGPHGNILPVPTNPTETELANVKMAIRDLLGRVFIPETQVTGWGNADSRQVTQDWQPKRLGANPPEALVTLYVEHRNAVLGACGVPPEVLSGSNNASGAA